MKIGRLFICCLVFLSCSEKKPLESSGGGTQTPESSYSLEIDPVLSYNRSTLLMVRDDSLLPSLNGIYSANANNPIRNPEYLQDKIVSPTLAINSNVIAFLRTQKLYFYNRSTHTASISSVSQNLQRILFMNDTVLIGNYSAAIYSLNYPSLTVNTIASGFSPTTYTKDTIAYLSSDAPSRQFIHKLTINPGPIKVASSDASVNIPIDTIYNTRPSSFGIEPTMNRYCFSIKSGSTYLIYAGGPGNETDHVVAESVYPGVVMLSSNRILFTGTDGRLYETDFNGSSSYPYWAALGSQN